MWEIAATTPGSVHLMASIKYVTLVLSWGSWYLICLAHCWRVIYADLCCYMNRWREWFVFPFQILFLRNPSEIWISAYHFSSPQCWVMMDLQTPRPFWRRLKGCIVVAMTVPQVASSKWLNMLHFHHKIWGVHAIVGQSFPVLRSHVICNRVCWVRVGGEP